MAGVVREQNLEKQIEKQMGCMAGFLQIFDRTQILTGKRLYTTKRLPSSTVVDACPEPEKSMESPAMSRELEKPHHARSMPSPEHFKQQQSPANELRSPVPESQSKSPLPLPVFELREGNKSSWKFCKESPRLSLDSRATFDARGSLKPKEIPTNASILSVNRCEKNGEETDDSEKQRRSPSVIARLMGLEKLPEWETEQAKTPELRRSASESRASRDLLQYRFIDGINFQLKQSQQQNMQNNISSNVIIDGLLRDQTANGRAVDPKKCNAVRNARAEPARAPHRGIGQRKSFFDSADFFPEPKQTVSIYGEIEKRLKMRGIDEPSKDLETLKQILEALQLKGLLHSKKPLNRTNQSNFVYDGSFSHDESPVVLMQPVRSTAPINRQGRYSYDSPSNFKARPPARRESVLSSDTLPAISPRRERPEIEHNVRNQNRGRSLSSPTRSESSVKSPNRRRPLSVETQRRTSNNNSIEQRRVSPVQSPKVSLRRNIPDQSSNRSPRNRKQAGDIYYKEEKVFVPGEDESSSISESSISTSSHTDTERSKLEDYKEGRHLLERCDKLLNSIAEMTATELQPSPVSVLDSSFYKEESSPSPIMKRSVDFKDELEDDIWSPAISPIQLKSEDCDYMYISDIIRASNYLPEDSDVFLLLEKQQYLKGRDTSKGSTLERKLVFDTITEILNQKRQLPPWKAVWGSKSKSPLQQIWSEFKRIRERDAADDLLEVICGMLKKDLAGDAMNGWGDSPIEMSESVLDIERLIFKDLIGETIKDLAAFPGKCNHQPFLPRRKLVF
ncbi:protein LONGIFOLIA 1 [Euphorbia lathyris]|uniref:protein LONGIFOLIA 1 n=1 Tax=Euphorbia lathyris TaxID=212925 RepID=UPI0033136B14